jgi:macrolide-specific efflux system membrane fusion protein
MKRSWLILTVGVLVVGTGVAVWGALGGVNEGEAVAQDAIARVERGDLSVQVHEVGQIQPLKKVNIKSKVAGQVAQLLITEGQFVKKNQVLLALDPTDFKRRLAEVLADSDNVAAELTRLEAGSLPEECEEAQAQWTQAKARAILARAEKERADRAYQESSLALGEYEASKTRALEAEAQVRVAQARWHRLKRGSRREDILAARARLRKAEVAVAAARDQLAYTVLRAPIDGTVIHRGIEVGEMVTPGVAETGDRTPLLTVADLRQLVVESDINQVQIGKLTLAQAVRVSVDALPDDVFSGHISSIAPASVPGREADVQLYKVKTLIESGPVAHLKPGMSADVDILVGEHPAVLRIPIETVTQSAGHKGEVTRLEKIRGDRYRKARQPVTLGVSTEQFIEIRAGVNEGDSLLIDPEAVKGRINKF